MASGGNLSQSEMAEKMIKLRSMKRSQPKVEIEIQNEDKDSRGEVSREEKINIDVASKTKKELIRGRKLEQLRKKKQRLLQKKIKIHTSKKIADKEQKLREIDNFISDIEKMIAMIL
jgi:hypothetical protein